METTTAINNVLTRLSEKENHRLTRAVSSMIRLVDACREHRNVTPSDLHKFELWHDNVAASGGPAKRDGEYERYFEDLIADSVEDCFARVAIDVARVSDGFLSIADNKYYVAPPPEYRETFAPDNMEDRALDAIRSIVDEDMPLRARAIMVFGFINSWAMALDVCLEKFISYRVKYIRQKTNNATC